MPSLGWKLVAARDDDCRANPVSGSVESEIEPALCEREPSRQQLDLHSTQVYGYQLPGVIIVDCVFHRNYVPNNGHCGGAIRIKESNLIEVSGSSFVNNSNKYDGDEDEQGGGAACFLSKSEVRNCTFEGNLAFAQGGAIRLFYQSSKIFDSRFERNRCGEGGGAIATSTNFGGVVELYNAHFVSNSVEVSPYTIDFQFVTAGGQAYYADELASGFEFDCCSDYAGGGALFAKRQCPCLILWDNNDTASRARVLLSCALSLPLFLEVYTRPEHFILSPLSQSRASRVLACPSSTRR